MLALGVGEPARVGRPPRQSGVVVATPSSPSNRILRVLLDPIASHLLEYRRLDLTGWILWSVACRDFCLQGRGEQREGVAGPSLDAQGAHGVFCLELGLLLAGKLLVHKCSYCFA